MNDPIPRPRRKSWKKSIVDEELVGGSVDVLLQPISDDRLEHALRPFTGTKKRARRARSTSPNRPSNNEIQKTSPKTVKSTTTLNQSASLQSVKLNQSAQSAKLNKSASLPQLPSSPNVSKDVQHKQDTRIKRSAELSHSGFLTETLPLMHRLPSQSEFLINVEFLPTSNITANVRMERKMLQDSLKRSNWGQEIPIAATDMLENEKKMKKQKRIQRKDQVLVRKAKIQYHQEQRKISTLLKNEMKGIRRIEKRNTTVRQRRMLQILSVAHSFLAFQQCLNNAKETIDRGRSASVLQFAFRKFIMRRNQLRADRVKMLLGMRIIMVISNLRAKVKRTAAKVVTAFVVAIPASTKALVALRLMRQRCIRIQRWWRSFLSCKLCRIRSLLRHWCFIESDNKNKIRKTIANQARRERADAKKTLATLQNISGESKPSNRKGKLSVDSLAKGALHFANSQYGHTEKIHKTLKHKEAHDALDMFGLMEVIKPVIQDSTNWLDEKYLFQGAQQMLLSIASQKKDKTARLRKRNKGGDQNSKKGKFQKRKVKKWSHEWDRWISTLKKWELQDWGLEKYPRTDIPIEIRIATVKNMLEKERHKYIRRSVQAKNSPFSKLPNENDEAPRALVSLHSISMLMNGQLNVTDLFDRQCQPMFQVFTSKQFEEESFLSDIIDVHLSM